RRSAREHPPPCTDLRTQIGFVFLLDFAAICLKEQAGNNFPEFSQSRTKLWQGLLTLPPRRPKDRSPTRTPAGDLQSSRQPGCGDSLGTRAEHPSTENQEVISGPFLRQSLRPGAGAPLIPGTAA